MKTDIFKTALISAFVFSGVQVFAGSKTKSAYERFVEVINSDDCAGVRNGFVASANSNELRISKINGAEQGFVDSKNYDYAVVWDSRSRHEIAGLVFSESGLIGFDKSFILPNLNNDYSYEAADQANILVKIALLEPVYIQEIRSEYSDRILSLEAGRKATGKPIQEADQRCIENIKNIASEQITSYENERRELEATYKKIEENQNNLMKKSFMK